MTEQVLARETQDHEAAEWPARVDDPRERTHAKRDEEWRTEHRAEDTEQRLERLDHRVRRRPEREHAEPGEHREAGGA